MVPFLMIFVGDFLMTIYREGHKEMLGMTAEINV